MSFTQLTTSPNIIASLPDTPTASAGYTSDVLKAYFDQYGGSVQTYLNSTLLPELEAQAGAEKIGAAPFDTITGTDIQSQLEEINTKANEAGDVEGPASSTTNNIAQFSDSTGKVLKNGVSISTEITTPGVDTSLPTTKAIVDYVITMGGGDTVAPASAVDGHIVQFDGTTGKILKDGLALTTTLSAPGVDTAVPSTKAIVDFVSELGGGDVVGPASSTNSHIAQFDGITGKVLKDGLALVTTVGSTGSDSSVPSEQAVREAITAAGDVDGPASATADNLAVFNGTTGKIIKDGGIKVSDIMQDVVNDTTPQLGGDLDANGNAYLDTTYDNGNSGSAKTINFLNGKYQKVNISANTTLTLATPTRAMSMLLRITYSGAYTVTWSSTPLRWEGATAPTLTKTAGRYDLVSLVYDGTNMSGGYNLNYTV